MFNSNFDLEGHFEERESIFTVLSPEELKELEKARQVIRCRRNEIIYKEGDTPTGMVYLHEGKVKIYKEGVGGREQIIRMVKSRGLVGFRSLLAGENHISSAVALEESIVHCIPEDFLFNTLLKNNNFSLHLLQNLAQELGFSNKRTISLTQKHIRGRLAESLLLLRDKYGFENDNATLKVYLSREDIANLSNMTTSNAIRTLSTFANEKVIAIDGRKIRLIDVEALEKISMLG
ncbi:MAG: Crp/Fnr family transcriptional regulator [Prolixibacteraceae bacterium]|jgi:CRP-like cAMP-binding protein|nr:Crp/Fnr family transcriptional regulator [Prolixibacteraceae bacterium]